MEYSKNLTTFTLDNLGINILYFPYKFSNAQQQISADYAFYSMSDCD